MVLFYLSLGLESLAVRMRKHCENALAVAKYLESNDQVSWVKYADLESDPYHELAKKYCPHGTCGVLSFGLKGDRDTAEKFTQRQMSEEQLKEAGVAVDLIRFSVGIEDADDIIADLKQAFEAIA